MVTALLVFCTVCLPAMSVTVTVMPLEKTVGATAIQKAVAASAEAPRLTPSPQSSVRVVPASPVKERAGSASGAAAIATRPDNGSPALPCRLTDFTVVVPYIWSTRNPTAFLKTRASSSDGLVAATITAAPGPKEATA